MRRVFAVDVLECPRCQGPMRILVLGDFSGRASRGLIDHGDALAERPTPAVDIDGIDDALYRYAPRLHLPLQDPDAPSIAVDFKQLDDFHPDALYRELAVFRSMRELRERLLAPESFPREAEEWGQARSSSGGTGEKAPDESPKPREDEGEMFERLLGRKPAERPQARAAPPREGVDITPFIRSIVRPYVVAAPSASQDHLVASVDQATTMQMRALLHDSAFEQLEAAWRGVDWLTRRVETGEELSIHLLDLSKDELVADLGATGGDIRSSGLYRLLVDKATGPPGGHPWSVLAGQYTFGTSPEDAALLEALGTIASRAGAPFVAAADPRLLGSDSLAHQPDPHTWKALDAEAQKRWTRLRSSPAARWVGLAIPRVLLRLPYGARTEPIDAFAFEEQALVPEHSSYLWSNPSIACSMLLARAFVENGWAMQPGDFLDIEDLPAHHFEVEGEMRLTPVAEAFLTESAAEQILRSGIMPVLSYRNRNAARLLRFQSLADPAAALEGPWQ